MTPDRGPVPTATMKITPITRSGAALRTFINSRIGCCSQGGEMLRAQARPKGTAITRARNVPHRAIWMVSHIWAA